MDSGDWISEHFYTCSTAHETMEDDGVGGGGGG